MCVRDNVDMTSSVTIGLPMPCCGMVVVMDCGGIVHVRIGSEYSKIEARLRRSEL